MDWNKEKESLNGRMEQSSKVSLQKGKWMEKASYTEETAKFIKVILKIIKR